MLPRYAKCVPFELELELKSTSRAARQLGTVERSWSQSKRCQLANFNAMRKRGLQPSGTYIHVPRGPPSRIIHAATGNGCLLCMCLGCRAAAGGGLLRRRNPLSEVEHVLYRRIMRLDETGLSQKEESKFEPALRSRGRRGLRSLGQPGDESFLLLVI